MDRIRENLRMALSRPWAVWALFATAVGVYGFLVLAEAYSQWFARLQWSPWVPTAIFLGRVVLGWHPPDDTMGTPLSFMLPGYRESLRKSSLWRAARWGTIFSMWSFSRSWSNLLLFWQVRQIWSHSPSGLPPEVSLPPEPSSLEMSLSIVGGFLGGATLSFLWTIGSLVHFRRRWLNIPFMGLSFAAALVLVWSPESRHAFVFWPVSILVSIFCCACFGVWLGDRDWITSGHRNTLLRVIGRPAFVEIDEMTVPWVERWLRSQVERRDYLSAARYVWADLYITLGPTFQYWKWILGLLVIITLAVGHLVDVTLALDHAGQQVVAVMFAALGAAAGTLRTPLTSTMLLPGGRKEKCYAAIAAGAVASLLLVVAALAVVALSWFIALLLGGTPPEGQRFSYAAIHPGTALLACLLVPWFLALRLLGYKVRFLNRIDWMILVAIFFVMPAIQTWSDGTRYMVLGGVLVGGWLCFLLLLHLAARHWSIGGQR